MSLTAVLGTNQVFKINFSGSLVDISDKIKDIKLPREVAMLDITALGASAKAFFAGLKDAKISINLFYDSALYVLLTGILGTSKAFEYDPAGTGTGTPKATGSIFIQNLEIGGPAQEVNMMTLSLQVNGAVTDGTN